MNGRWLLSPTAISVKNAAVFYYIHAVFLYITCHSCLYVTALKVNQAKMQQWHL